MAVQEDARTAARRIVEEVLAGQGPRTVGESTPGADRGDGAAPATPDQVADDVPVPVEGDDVVVDLTEPGPVAAADPEPSAERLRARALVAEVLEAHQARQAEAEARARAEAEAAAVRAGEEEAERRAAEAEAEARAAVEAEERERALAEERERARWAEADREVASETVQMPQQDDGADRASEPTTPLGVAELAAAERAASREGDGGGEVGAPDDGAGPERTAVLPVQGDPVTASDADRTQLVAVPEGGATAIAAPAEGGSAVIAAADQTPAAEGLESPSAPVLEAIVDPGDVVEPPRTGRWLLASILGAVTLAILFPLAINALMDLVAMS